MYNLKKLSWIILGTAFLFNIGAYILTSIALSSGRFEEANGFMRQFFDSNHLYALLPMLTAYIILTLIHRRQLARSDKFTGHKKLVIIYLLPSIAFVIFGMDFFHNIGLLYFGIPIFNELKYIIIFR